MSKKAGQTAAAAALNMVQKDSYLAWIEWPVLLFLQLREVEKHLTVVATPTTPVVKNTANPVAAGGGANKPAASRGKPIIARSQAKSTDSGTKPANGADAAVADLLDSFRMEE